MPPSQESNQTPRRSTGDDGERAKDTLAYTATSVDRNPDDTVTHKSAFNKSDVPSQDYNECGKAKSLLSQSSSDCGLPGLEASGTRSEPYPTEASGARSEPYPTRSATPERGRGASQGPRPTPIQVPMYIDGLLFSETITETERVTVQKTKIRNTSVDVRIGGTGADNVTKTRSPVRKA